MKKTKLNLITQLLLTSVFSTTVAQQAFAVDFNSVTSGVPLGSVSSGSSADYAADPSSAPNQAPSQASLTTFEPQSVVSGKYINNMFSGTATYGDVAGLTPGAVSAPINGYGGSDVPALSIHGFQDGQYNVLFDGIPFADGRDQTHHQNQFMMASDMGSEVVDRGPGRADTVGLATFGGTVFVNSKDPLQNAGLTTRVQYGSFNTRLFGAEFDTGDLKNYGDARGYLDVNHSQTDGAYALNTVRRTNVFGKLIKPINDDNTITIVGMVNDTYQHAIQGGTPDGIAANGGVTPGLNYNGLSQNSYGSNHDHFSSYMYYIQLQSQYGKWSFDNKLFTTEYTHTNLQTANPGGNTQNNTVVNGFTGTQAVQSVNGLANFTQNGSDLLGNTSLTQNTTYGDVFRGKYNFGRDDLGMGVWLNRQTEQSNQYATDFTGGYQYSNSGNQLWLNSYNTYQPYVEYTWRPIKNLEVTPGVKYDMITEDQLAAYSGVGTVTGYGSATYHALLPSLDIHYYLRKNWTVYAQAAEGFLPPLAKQAFSVKNNAFGINSNINPQNTKNLQFGTVYKANKYSVSADAYFINNNNLIQNAGIGPGGYTIFSNAGNTNFSGIDTEATYKVGYGYSLYGNYSFERTQSAAASPIYNAPVVTSALGLLYEKNNFNANLIAKEVGSRIGGQDQNNNNYYLGSYTLVNFSAGYKFNHLYGYNHDTEIQFQANNLTNRYDPIYFNGNTAVNSNPLLYTLFGRTFNVNLTTTF
ncbi:MAG: hypothetical protein B7Z65_03965 [Ferrovum sp. 21-44-67]|nr:MAG: hypothetical protein B7Z65_03965 [Ferrovum sp. 21-44-67]HQU05745.1 TonB-dependent receptor [Ferrovaceae bacterium]